MIYQGSKARIVGGFSYLFLTARCLPQLPNTSFVLKFCNFVTDVCEKSKILVNKGVPRGF